MSTGLRPASLAWVAALTLLAPRFSTSAPSPAMAVHLVDYAGAPPRQLTAATNEASRLWAAIGVPLTWTTGELNASNVTRAALNVTLIVLRNDMAQKMIVAEHRGDGVLGRAVPEARRAYIFYDRAKRASGQLAASESDVLGRVFAHELGHLLIGHAHSSQGLMRAAPDLGSAREAFDPRDGAKIRAQIVLGSSGAMLQGAAPIAAGADEAASLVHRLRDLPWPMPASGPSNGMTGTMEILRDSLYARLGEIGPIAYPALAEGLRDPDVRERRNVALLLMLRAIPPQARNLDPMIPALSRAIEDQDDQVASISAAALGMIGPAAAVAVPSLIRLMHESLNAATRASAATSLGTIGSAAALPALRGALNDTSPDVRTAAGVAIGRLESK